MEHTQKIIAWELLAIFVLTGLLVANSFENTITGMATAIPSAEDVKSEIESALPGMTFMDDISDVSVCLIVNMDANTAYSYDIVKVQGITDVSVSDDIYCKGEDKEDFIISYVSYDKFKEQFKSDSSFSYFKSTADGTNFYVLPSKQIASGMLLNDASDFKSSFGNFLNKNFDETEVDQILSSTLPQEQTPSSTSYFIYIIFGTVILVVLIISLIFVFSRKPDVVENLELTAYIKSSVAQGYDEEQVRTALLDSGWDKEEVDKAIKSANSGVPSSQKTI